jgi:glycosyltransferase involved in cell wall biosynthesis
VSRPTDPLGGARVRFGPEIFRIQARGGVSRYVVEVHRELVAAGVDSVIEAGWHTSAVLDGVPRVEGRPAGAVGRLPGGNVLTRLADEAVARRAVARLGPGDIWHPSYYPRRLPDGRGAARPRLAVTVHDMIHERFAASMSPRDHSAVRKAAACAAADVVCCNSQDTADDLQDRLGIDSRKIVVTPLGVVPVAPVPRPSPFGDRPYVVYIGDRRSPYKNWEGLLDALRDGRGDLALLCIGAPADRVDDEALRRRGLTARVRFEGGSDGEVAGRLAASAGLVYPSLYEGFGLPPLEALAQGCPVVASDAGAIAEVVGAIAILVEPTVEGIGSGLDRLMAGGPDVERQRTGGPAYAARYTWSATAAGTIGAYRRALA